jgi:hypothetical protein
VNFLQLCQRTARECSVSGVGPPTVINQIGELSRIVNWVATALNDIETAHPDWGWMKKDVSFPTIAGQGQYTPAQTGIAADTFGMWEMTRWRNYVTTVGNISEIDMLAVSYDDWRDSYNFGATRYTQSRPMVVAVAPDQSLCLGVIPADGYTITGEYFRAPEILAADADLPDLPVQFHMMIVYKAMMYYGGYEAAPEVYNRGELEFGKMMARLDALRLPPMSY